MPCTREELEKRERLILAPFAQLSDESRGRVHPEPPPTWRTQYQRDRDRVIHSRAFRRLEYKTQVFLNGTGDHLRTRLTHTMEVAAISRNIARALRLNEDLAETIALAHDLGHSPFGHTGEHALDALMKEHGGFEHNRQSLRIVEELEQKYPTFSGLNLSWEVREGLMKHRTSYDSPEAHLQFTASSSSLEAQVANLADEITYYSHDLDDGLDSGLLQEEDLKRHVQIWRLAAAKVEKENGELPEECRWYFIIRCLIDWQVQDVVETTENRLLEFKIKSADQVRAQEEPMVAYSSERKLLNLQLRDYLYQHLYYNNDVHDANVNAVKMLEELFAFYLQFPDQLGAQARRRMTETSLHRAVCDYLSGMTDRYTRLQYERLIKKGT